MQAKAASRSLVIAGDGDGTVDASETGLLAQDPLVFYSAGFGKDTQALRDQVDRGATLVVTDSNRDRARRWSTVTDTVGYTEGPGSHPLTEDLTDSRLDLFPDAPPGSYTTTKLVGVKGVAASNYGNPITYNPEDRAADAFDGDLDTAWRTGAFDDVSGDRIRVVLDHPITTDHVNLVQVLKKPNERYITHADLTFDGGSTVPADLGAASRRPAGQTVTFPTRTFRTFEITIRDTNLGQVLNYGGVSPVGFAEIRLRDDQPGARPVRVREIVQMPTDLLRAVGDASLQRSLVVLMNRERVIPVPPRSDPELALSRSFVLPTARSFGVGSEVGLAPNLADDHLDRLLGYDGPVVASSSARLSGAPEDRASAALDHDPTTAWVTPFSDVNQTITVKVPEPITLDRLNLQVVADGRHSVPTKIEVRSDTGEHATVDLPAISDEAAADAVVAAPVSFPPVTGSEFKVKVLDVRPVTTREWYCECDITMPVGIAELGMSGVPPVQVPDRLPGDCREDLVTIDGRPVPARVVGTTADALALRPLDLVSCTGSGVPEVALNAGTHVVQTARGDRAGFDVNRLALASESGGAAWTSFDADGALVGTGAPATDASAPKLVVTSSGRTKTKVRITGATKPFWLVMGQSSNAGWRATVDGKELGESTLTDAYANGWLVRPDAAGGAIEATMEWVPQRTVNRAIALSIVGVLACLGILVGAAIRRRRRRSAEVTAAGGRSGDRGARVAVRRGRTRPGLGRNIADDAGRAVRRGSVRRTVGRSRVRDRGPARAASPTYPGVAQPAARVPARLLRRVHRREAVAHELPADVRVADVLLEGPHARLDLDPVPGRRRARRDRPLPKRPAPMIRDTFRR